jgi:uncharacterized CHY-type Zn-finger protein
MNSTAVSSNHNMASPDQIDGGCYPRRGSALSLHDHQSFSQPAMNTQNGHQNSHPLSAAAAPPMYNQYVPSQPPRYMPSPSPSHSSGHTQVSSMSPYGASHTSSPTNSIVPSQAPSLLPSSLPSLTAPLLSSHMSPQMSYSGHSTHGTSQSQPRNTPHLPALMHNSQHGQPSSHYHPHQSSSNNNNNGQVSTNGIGSSNHIGYSNGMSPSNDLASSGPPSSMGPSHSLGSSHNQAYSHTHGPSATMAPSNPIGVHYGGLGSHQMGYTTTNLPMRPMQPQMAFQTQYTSDRHYPSTIGSGASIPGMHHQGAHFAVGNPTPHGALNLSHASLVHPYARPQPYDPRQIQTVAQAAAQVADRPFKCDQCTQAFNRNHDLKRHRRIHLSIKPFPCGSCPKTFSRKDALKRHRLVKGCKAQPTPLPANKKGSDDIHDNTAVQGPISRSTKEATNTQIVA